MFFDLLNLFMVRIFCGSAIGENWKTGKNVSRHGSISLHNYTDTNLRKFAMDKVCK